LPASLDEHFGEYLDDITYSFVLSTAEPSSAAEELIEALTAMMADQERLQHC
jgi:hypothetical protein